LATQPLPSWTRLRQSLLDEIRDLDDVTCRVPGAEDPISLEEGLRWLEESVQRGLRVDYRVVPEDGVTVLWLQHWSLDEPRPPWPEDWSESVDEPRR
jgi:hypothetical protein